MLKSAKLKEKLINCELSIGSWVTIGHHSIVEIMATAGFEWLTLDLEHSAIELQTAQGLIAQIQGLGLNALVRVGKNDDLIIKRVMDAGADGVIVPMVNSRSDAERAVSAVRYPPSGNRGVGLARAQNYGIGFNEYKEWLENDSIIIAQIEHIQAVENIDEILTTPGIDGTIVGPYDLSGSMGYPGEFEREDVKAALENVKAACRKHRKSLGFHVISSEQSQLQAKIAEGYNFLAFSLDFFFLGDRAREEMKKAKLS